MRLCNSSNNVEGVLRFRPFLMVASACRSAMAQECDVVHVGYNRCEACLEIPGCKVYLGLCVADSDCQKSEEGTCYSTDMFGGNEPMAAQAICEIYHSDLTLCEDNTSCNDCVSSIKADGSTCRWYTSGSLEACFSGGCGPYGCGTTTCDEGDLFTNEDSTVAPTFATLQVSPTKSPTNPPTKSPTRMPTRPPTDQPSRKPTTDAPTPSPTSAPTKKPASTPTNRPTDAQAPQPTHGGTTNPPSTSTPSNNQVDSASAFAPASSDDEEDGKEGSHGSSSSLPIILGVVAAIAVLLGGAVVYSFLKKKNGTEPNHTSVHTKAVEDDHVPIPSTAASNGAMPLPDDATNRDMPTQPVLEKPAVNV